MGGANKYKPNLCQPVAQRGGIVAPEQNLGQVRLQHAFGCAPRVDDVKHDELVPAVHFDQHGVAIQREKHHADLLVNQCWGRFAESKILLYIVCNAKYRTVQLYSCTTTDPL